MPLFNHFDPDQDLLFLWREGEVFESLDPKLNSQERLMVSCARVEEERRELVPFQFWSYHEKAVCQMAVDAHDGWSFRLLLGRYRRASQAEFADFRRRMREWNGE